MDFRLFCLMFYTLVATYVETCEVSNDEKRCIYIVTCDRFIDMNMYWDVFSERPQHSYYDYGELMDICPTYVLYRGHKLYPMYLVLTQMLNEYESIGNTVLIPNTNTWNQDEMLNIIYSLDISNSGYRQTPVLNSMANLVKLNMSNNALTTAVLSNVNELNMLTELDLSYNIVDDIQVNENEYPYKNIKNINLSHNHLVKLSDGIFRELKNLRMLNLSYNLIDTLNRFTFENISRLEELDLSDNRLTSINSSLFRFSELKILNLRENRLTELSLSDFERLRKLEILNVSLNNIFTIYVNALNELNSFTSFSSLTSLDLSRNKLKSIPKGLFKNNTILSFAIEENRLEGFLEKEIFQGVNVEKLDLSHQFLTAIKDYAFNDMISLKTLLLQSNKIQSLSKMCFKNLVKLHQLNLSNNQITKLHFETADLYNLESLLLKNNRLTEINIEQLQYLNSLRHLDISENYISRIEPRSFQSMRKLVIFDMTNNSLSGQLEKDTFEGLLLISRLDLSPNMLTTIQNASFNHMIELNYLNMSHGKINELQYNTFMNMGRLDTLDLSYNKLEDFTVNITQLIGLSALMLHNNLIKSLSLSSFNNIVTHNNIGNVYNESITSLIGLRYLDVSWNENLTFTVGILYEKKILNTLILSGVKTHINFGFILKDCSIINLNLSHGNVDHINELHLPKLANVYSLDLSHNIVSMLQIESFTHLETLEFLDLSFNKITFIQSGVFKDNRNLYFLNISHNFISSIQYGMFRGLIKLSILDMSYNNIKDLETEKFYEVEDLSELIVDHNKIDSLLAEDFVETKLKKISIGDNPLPCEILARLSKKELPFTITAIKIDEHNGENVKGVTCNKQHKHESAQPLAAEVNDNKGVYNGIQKNSNNLNYKVLKPGNSDVEYLNKISDIMTILSLNTDINNSSNLMLSNTNTMLNKSNIILNKILIKLDQAFGRIFNTSSEQQTAPKISKFLSTQLPLIGNNSNINWSIDNNTSMDSTTELGSAYKLVSRNTNKKVLFTEICVGLILLILVGLVLYKVYKSTKLLRNRLTISTRELPGAIENSAL